MPIQNGQVAVGTAAVVIPVTSVNPFLLEIHNNDNSDEVFLGGAGVTTSNGYQLNKLETVKFEMTPGDRMFCVSTKTGHTISWLAILKQT